MKTYNLDPNIVTIGKEISFPAISLGEQGRGRLLTHVPCPETFVYVEPGETRSGKPRLNKSESSLDWIARVNTCGGYKRGANGKVYAPPGARVKVLALGTGAFGAAGRVGGWDDVLLIIPDNTIIRVKPSRGDAYLLWFPTAGEVLKMGYSEAELAAEHLGFELYGSTPGSSGEFKSV
jgi:hypothetical protein